MRIRRIIIFNLFIFAICLPLIAMGSYFWDENRVSQGEQKRKELYEKILDGTSIKPTDVTINYSEQISIGSPMVFGGAQYPSADNPEVWDMLQNVGVTAMRTDFYIENMAPYNTSIEDYKNNKNSVQNIENWNHDFIQSRTNAYTSARQHGMKTMGIMSYSPSWLTYSHTTRGVPKDWSVYEDIVKKAYAIHRDNIDYIELWNEPTYSKVFLDVTDSSLSPTDAYAQIFYHAAKAIREVDAEKNDGKRILIGGPVSDNPNDTSMLEAILKDEKTRQYIDFISYHNYVMDEPSWDAHKEVLKKYHMDNLPIFITEWNYNPKEKEDSPYKTSYPAIIFTANKLVDFLKMGVAGANYYSLLPVSESGKYTEFLSFYRLKNGQSELLPQSRTWTLMSKDMSLGKGVSKIYTSQDNVEDLNTIGFINSLKQQGVVIVNSSNSPVRVNMHFKNTGMKNYIKTSVYYASANNNAEKSIYEGLLKEKNNLIDFPFYIPEESVMGVVFKEENAWYDLGNILN